MFPAGITNVSKGLIDLDVDGSPWCGPKCVFRIRALDMIPHYMPDLLAVLKPGTKIKVALGFEQNATQVRCTNLVCQSLSCILIVI